MELPDANETFDEILERVDSAGGEAAVFLDFDGTLAPIVARPGAATIPDQTRATVARLADVCRVAVVSGRDREDVQRRVGLDAIAYAGSHGFDIRTADGEVLNPTEADAYLPHLDRAERMLDERIGEVPGLTLERKRYSLAIHYREVSDEDLDGVRQQVDAVVSAVGRLRLIHGKKVFDLQPELDWHKGRAIDTLLEALGLDRPGVVPFYIGDDVTDEQAFLTLDGRGITVVIRDDQRATGADYELESPDEVRRFLDRLADHLE